MHPQQDGATAQTSNNHFGEGYVSWTCKFLAWRYGLAIKIFARLTRCDIPIYISSPKSNNIALKIFKAFKEMIASEVE